MSDFILDLRAKLLIANNALTNWPLMFWLSFSVTYTYIHKCVAVLFTRYTRSLISPWCPISLDLWWPSFRSFNFKALKCLPSQLHTHTCTHPNRPIQYTCNYTAFLLHSLLSLPHGSIYLHKLSSPKCKPCLQIQHRSRKRYLWLVRVSWTTVGGVWDGC